jgi:D-alanyl-D-alanine carboxypeptidase
MTMLRTDLSPRAIRLSLAALFAALLADLLEFLVDPVSSGDGAKVVAGATEQHGLMVLSAILLLASAAFVVPAVFGLVRLLERRGRTLGWTAMALAVMGALGHAALAASYLLWSSMPAGTGSNAALIAAIDRANDAGSMAILAPLIIAFPVCFVVFFAAMVRGGIAPRWVLAPALAAPVCAIAAHSTVAALALLLVASGALAVRVLRGHGPGRAAVAVAASVFAAILFAPAALATTPPQVALQLDRTLQQVVRANHTFPGVALAVRTPTLEWTGAAGVADRASHEPLAGGAGFRIASVTKTFTAAAVLRLVEERKLALDDPIARHLDAATVTLLRRDGYDVDAIRVRQLLQHTSGLAGDYSELEPYLQFVVSHPHHRWTRLEQVRFVLAHSKPLSRPGAEYHYSDTGYVLLGEMLERVTKRGLGAAYRSLLRFDRLGLDETYLETLEPAPAHAKPRAHQYLGTLDMTAFDPSFDIYGAGGHVSSVDDLARFYRALVEGRVLEHASTLRTMLGRARPQSARDLPMGIEAAQLGRERCYGHGGFWGVAAYHCPGSHTTIVTSITQAQGFIPPTGRLLLAVQRIVAGAA